MAEVWTMGEMLVEIMRPRPGMLLSAPGEFIGPFPSGAPAIFIDTVARLGHSAGIIGGVGVDDFGRCLLERLKADGVNVEHVLQLAGRATAVAFVTYFPDGSRRFLYHIDGTPAVMAEFARSATEVPARFFHVMGCSLMANSGFRAQIVRAVEHFHRQGAKVSFDPNVRSELLGGRDILQIVGPVLEHCAVLLPGEAELKLLTGEDEADVAVRGLFRSPVLETVVLKRGKIGATVYSRKAKVDITAYTVEEADPTGAGDCFDAGFICGLLEGKPLRECGQMAVAAGALNAATFGPMEAEISRDSVRDLISRNEQRLT